MWSSKKAGKVFTDNQTKKSGLTAMMTVSKKDVCHRLESRDSTKGISLWQTLV